MLTVISQNHQSHLKVLLYKENLIWTLWWQWRGVLRVTFTCFCILVLQSQYYRHLYLISSLRQSKMSSWWQVSVNQHLTSQSNRTHDVLYYALRYFIQLKLVEHQICTDLLMHTVWQHIVTVLTITQPKLHSKSKKSVGYFATSCLLAC